MNVRIVKSASGSYRWYAVPADQPDDHPTMALWLDSGIRFIEGTMHGTISTDGGVRYFVRKRDLIALLTAAGHTPVS